jgi:hypothetical protein
MIVHLLKILLAGKRRFQNCPPAFSPKPLAASLNDRVDMTNTIN